LMQIPNHHEYNFNLNWELFYYIFTLVKGKLCLCGMRHKHDQLLLSKLDVSKYAENYGFLTPDNLLK